MSDFGDFDDDDATDVAPADPEQVARKLHRLQVAEMLESRRWDDLDRSEQLRHILVIGRLLAWLRRQGSHP